MNEPLVVRRETQIAALPATVFAFLTDPEKIISWMGAEATTEAYPGGLYLLKGVGGDHARVARGAFREVVPVHRLAYTFGWEGGQEVPPGSSLIEIDLIEQNGGSYSGRRVCRIKRPSLASPSMILPSTSCDALSAQCRSSSSNTTGDRRQPVISVDTKKKELIGNFKNGGTDYRPKGKPRRVNVHDFEDKKLGKVVPYGVYDVTANAGFVSVGITSDTAEFAVQSIRCWRERMGRRRYPHARELTITADCGGELIGATTTKAGLRVESALDTRAYQKGIKVGKAEMNRLDITGDPFHPEWNYTIRPRLPTSAQPAKP